MTDLDRVLAEFSLLSLPNQMRAAATVLDMAQAEYTERNNTANWAAYSWSAKKLREVADQWDNELLQKQELARKMRRLWWDSSPDGSPMPDWGEAPGNVRRTWLYIAEKMIAEYDIVPKERG